MKQIKTGNISEGIEYVNTVPSTTTLEALDKVQAMVDELIILYQAAEDYIEKSPCDPDIYPDQIVAWSKYNELKKQFKEKYLVI